MRVRSLVERLRGHADTQGEQPALLTATARWSWAALMDDAEQCARQLRDGGLPPAAFVALAVARGPEFAVAFAGIQAAGAVPVIVDPTDPAQAAAVLERLRPAAVVATPETLAGPLQPYVTWAAEVRRHRLILRPAAARPLPQPRRAPPGLSHVIFTSGSTGWSKGIAWSVARAHEWVEAFRQRRQAGPTAGTAQGRRWRRGLLLPLCAAAGFGPLFVALSGGDRVVLTSDPLPHALAIFAELGANWLACTPTHVEILLRSGWSGPPMTVTVSAGPVPPDRLQALARLPWVAGVYKSYAMTECGRISILTPADLATKAHSSGRPCAARRVRIVNRQRRELPPGRIGEVEVELPVWTAVDGYLDAPPRLAARCAGGVLRTGDRGYVDDDGYLVICDRVTEMIKVAGRSTSLVRIERELRAAPHAPPLAVVGAPHPRYTNVPALVFVPGRGTATPAALRAHAVAHLRRDEVPRWFLPRPSLPLTATDKLRRRTLTAEVRRWVALWPHTVAVADALWPARRQALPPVARAAAPVLVDGWPLRPERGRVAPGAVRPVSLLLPGDPPALLVSATLAHGTDDRGAVRHLSLPYVHPDYATPARLLPLLRLLQRLARALPGPRAGALVCDSREPAVVAALARLGFRAESAGRHVRLESWYRAVGRGRS